MKRFKAHILFIGIFFPALALFLRDLVFMRGSFLYGDNFVQFYPWMRAYSEALKNFHFPFWASLMGSGFPLMAEGQIGGFYPLNIIIFFLLPMKAAYNFSILLHFAIAGAATYAYSRKIGADTWGAVLAALVFCFGSCYAGLFCTIMTLRVLAWFPLVLFLFEAYFDSGKLRFILVSGVIAGCQLLAGHVQMAFYSILFYAVYFLYSMQLRRTGRLAGRLWAGIVFAAVSCIIALPQILLTLRLASFSGRGSATLDFALWRSWPPYGIFGLVFSYPTLSLGTSFYVGILSLFFVLVSVYSLRTERKLRPLAAILLVSLFFALGQYNPLYTWFLKLSHFYSFRVPSRFLFFGAFALSVLAGCGFSSYFNKASGPQNTRSMRLFRGALVSCAALFLIAKAGLFIFKDKIENLGAWYVQNFVYGKMNHRYDLEHYLDQIHTIYASLARGFSFSNIYVICAWCMLVAGLLLPVLLKRRSRALVMGVIMLDLFVFSFYGIGFSGQIRSWDYLRPTHESIYSLIKSDPGPHRILPLGIAGGTLPNWSYPNANMSYRIESVALYSPLVGNAYREAFSGLEAIDDSLGVKLPEAGALSRTLGTLRLLNVGYVVSHKELHESFLTFLKEEDGIYLYALQSAYPKIFFTQDISGEISPGAQVCIIEHAGEGELAATVIADAPGFVVFSQSYYPGWAVYVDGSKKELIKVHDLVQSVAVTAGTHRVLFRFRPDFTLTHQ